MDMAQAVTVNALAVKAHFAAALNACCALNLLRQAYLATTLRIRQSRLLL